MGRNINYIVDSHPMYEDCILMGRIYIYMMENENTSSL